MPVVLDLKPLRKFERQIIEGLKGGATTPVRKAFKQIAQMYREWAKERFTRFARGAGDWAPLKPSTIRRRRKGKAKKLRVTKGATTRTKTVAQGKVSILWDTGTLIGGLDPTFTPAKGALEQDIPGGIRVGFGGQARHPKGKGASIADIANFHQAGAPPNLPAREIIVLPPMSEQQRYGQRMEDALGESWKKATA